MSQNLDNQDSPRIGIFWYDIRNDDLFGVVSSHASEARVSKGLANINTLHRDYWEKQYNRLKFKNNGEEVYPYIGDYKDTPRGRVFYDVNDNRYIVNVGSWINEYTQAKALIIDEFNLEGQNYLFEIAIHWEIGHSWEG
ncbi:MAG: hypothetical protein LBR97_06770 [Dysgonamonadaceae bacterium]|nr:hypothetical protein [Dysgonamonadaceae bacterium]